MTNFDPDLKIYSSGNVKLSIFNTASLTLQKQTSNNGDNLYVCGKWHDLQKVNWKKSCVIMCNSIVDKNITLKNKKKLGRVMVESVLYHGSIDQCKLTAVKTDYLRRWALVSRFQDVRVTKFETEWKPVKLSGWEERTAMVQVLTWNGRHKMVQTSF